MSENAEKAIKLREQGYNCAQAIVCTYCDRLGMDHEAAYRISEGFGLGMGIMDMCGALTGAFMLAGCKQSGGSDHPGETKAQTYQVTKAMAAAFREKNGTWLCKELKGVEDGKVRRSCPDCIRDACELIEQHIIA